MKAMCRDLFLTIIAIVGVVFIALPSSAQKEQMPGANVAIVNGSAITHVDLDREMEDVKQRLIRSGKSVEQNQLEIIRKDVLESLIDRELIYQKSQEVGIKVEDESIKNQFDSLKNRFPTENDFKKALGAMNLSEADLTFQIKKNMAIDQFITKEFADKITVSDTETKNFYDSNPDAFKKPGQIKVSHILIRVDPTADKSKKTEAHKKIEDILGKIKKGGDFAALAKEFSQCPSSTSGGDLGFFERGQMVKPFEEAAFALSPGEVSGIVETNFGYHIIKSFDRKPGGIFAYEDVKGKLQQYLKQEKLREEVSAYADKLENKAEIKRYPTAKQ